MGIEYNKEVKKIGVLKRSNKMGRKCVGEIRKDKEEERYNR